MIYEFLSHLELWVEAEQEGLSSAVAGFTDFERIRRKSPKHLTEPGQQFSKALHIATLFIIADYICVLKRFRVTRERWEPFCACL